MVLPLEIREGTGSGVLIRDDKGNWLNCNSRAIGHTTSIVTELLWGLRDGLILCFHLHLEATEIELDAEAVVCLLNSNFESLGEFAYIVNDCRDLIRNLALLQRGVRQEQDFVTL